MENLTRLLDSFLIARCVFFSLLLSQAFERDSIWTENVVCVCARSLGGWLSLFAYFFFRTGCFIFICIYRNDIGAYVPMCNLKWVWYRLSWNCFNVVLSSRKISITTTAFTPALKFHFFHFIVDAPFFLLLLLFRLPGFFCFASTIPYIVSVITATKTVVNGCVGKLNLRQKKKVEIARHSKVNLKLSVQLAKNDELIR